jgi:endo-1,4-beta-xylanase
MGFSSRSGCVIKTRNGGKPAARLLIAACVASAAIFFAQTADAPRTLRAAAQEHHLLMGTAADAEHLDETDYASVLAREYSMLEPENEMKFGPIHPEPDRYDFAAADKLVAFGEAHGMKVRGHNLVSDGQLADWVTSPRKRWTAAALNRVLAEHIANEVGHYKGKVFAWDVVNEAFDQDGKLKSTIWYNSPGIGFAKRGTKTIEQSLVWAHAADPAAKLFVNDYDAETINRKSNALYAMARDFVTRGVPLSGIGFQLHVETGFDSNKTLVSFRKNIERFAALGIEVQFTEVDVRLRNGSPASLAAQANTYRDILGECLRMRACTAFQTWGFTDKYSWIPESKPGYGWALPFDQNYREKPAYSAMLKELTSGGESRQPPRAPR